MLHRTLLFFPLFVVDVNYPVTSVNSCSIFTWDICVNINCFCVLLRIYQQKLAKREGGTIDRSQDIARLKEFYKLYREKNNVDKLREEEMQLRESGVFSGYLGEYVSKLWNQCDVFKKIQVVLSFLPDILSYFPLLLCVLNVFSGLRSLLLCKLCSFPYYWSFPVLSPYVLLNCVVPAETFWCTVTILCMVLALGSKVKVF